MNPPFRSYPPYEGSTAKPCQSLDFGSILPLISPSRSCPPMQAQH